MDLYTKVLYRKMQGEVTNWQRKLKKHIGIIFEDKVGFPYQDESYLEEKLIEYLIEHPGTDELDIQIVELWFEAIDKCENKVQFGKDILAKMGEKYEKIDAARTARRRWEVLKAKVIEFFIASDFNLSRNDIAKLVPKHIAGHINLSQIIPITKEIPMNATRHRKINGRITNKDLMVEDIIEQKVGNVSVCLVYKKTQNINAFIASKEEVLEACFEQGTRLILLKKEADKFKSVSVQKTCKEIYI